MPERTDEQVSSRMEPELNILRPQLTGEQWLLISDFFLVPSPDPRGGRPRADSRRCLEGILWVLRSNNGAGRTCLDHFPHTSLVGDASSSGRGQACGTKRGADSSTSWIARAR